MKIKTDLMQFAKQFDKPVVMLDYATLSSIESLPEHMLLEGECINDLSWRSHIWSVTRLEDFTLFYSVSGAIFQVDNDKIVYKPTEQELDNWTLADMLDVITNQPNH